MAKTFPMSPVKTLQQLESQMNAHGSDLGLGMIQLTAQQQALAIEQTRNGTCEYDFDQPLAVLMAETYLVWMKQQGANDSHITVSIESVSKDKMTFLFHVIR
nr:hypothetical protein [Vibrio aphrogenes]